MHVDDDEGNWFDIDFLDFLLLKRTLPQPSDFRSTPVIACPIQIEKICYPPILFQNDWTKLQNDF